MCFVCTTTLAVGILCGRRETRGRFRYLETAPSSSRLRLRPKSLAKRLRNGQTCALAADEFSDRSPKTRRLIGPTGRRTVGFNAPRFAVGSSHSIDRLQLEAPTPLWFSPPPPPHPSDFCRFSQFSPDPTRRLEHKAAQKRLGIFIAESKLLSRRKRLFGGNPVKTR